MKRINILSLSLITGAILSISACSMTPPKHMMDVQAGENITLNEPLTIRAGSARVYIQNGQITGGSFNQYEPHCRLEIQQLREENSTIQPDIFSIERVQIGEELVAQRKLPQILAQIGFDTNSLNQTAHAEDSDQDSTRVETFDYVHFYINSKKQNNLLRFTCAGALGNGGSFDPPKTHTPQREDINEILGKVASIN